jgi:hypothetical protein
MSEVLPSQKSDLLLDLDPGGSGRNAGSAGDGANCEPFHGANRGLGRVCVPRRTRPSWSRLEWKPYLLSRQCSMQRHDFAPESATCHVWQSGTFRKVPPDAWRYPPPAAFQS